MTTRDVILPGATLGVLGGGQLGRMFVHAAQSMGYATAVLDPDPASPAGLVSHHHLKADYLDAAALAELAKLCAAFTTEFENVPAQALDALAITRPVAPAGAAVLVCQDRALEKAHFVASGVPCAPHALIETPEQLAAISDDLLPGILKTARLGYDGKGQVRVKTRAELAQAWDELKRVPCLLEKMLPLDFEVSVIVARGRDGQIVHFPVQHNLHRDGILAVTTVPAPGVSEALSKQVINAAQTLAASLNYVGVLCVEFFILQDGSLVANEMAPRPHNSGHHTIDACDVSQFEMQVRAMTRLPLVAPQLHSPCFMLNLLGDLWFDDAAPTVQREPDWAAVLALPGTHLHLYGKTDARRARKMGHLTVTGATADLARDVALKSAAILGIESF
ncbi:5-(carboxyamino)imidazole ribonucleotide synthase [Aquabacterium sp. CECT 9606]|uniref:5-(carboxyamino)imidazole ribonucleotide synthase n=1 Tax=Aquabacterium sp. CECT 9606 TaxID=2845822 RepID=UPI001E5B6AA7|nr:5-(carboxyamino)imidazole ribonucleotide synthase [Aquabacterium sp. CECT 9606]CAH0347822.1 N5-carboxyaminoimidazole ribonucleotide synthase [Aquabacterium sp. CECT 9606]